MITLLVASAIAVMMIAIIAVWDARIRAQIAEDEFRASRRQVVLSRSFRCGGAK